MINTNTTWQRDILVRTKQQITQNSQNERKENNQSYYTKVARDEGIFNRNLKSYHVAFPVFVFCSTSIIFSISYSTTLKVCKSKMVG